MHHVAGHVARYCFIDQWNSCILFLFFLFCLSTCLVQLVDIRKDNKTNILFQKTSFFLSGIEIHLKAHALRRICVRKKEIINLCHIIFWVWSSFNMKNLILLSIRIYIFFRQFLYYFFYSYQCILKASLDIWMLA